MEYRIVTEPGSDLENALKAHPEVYSPSKHNFLINETGVDHVARCFGKFTEKELAIPAKGFNDFMREIGQQSFVLTPVTLVLHYMCEISRKTDHSKVFREKDALEHVKTPWTVQEKGTPDTDSWEVSVIHISFAHGRASYGWFGHDKKMIWSAGGPCHYIPVPGTEDGYRQIAKDLCDKLNKEQNALILKEELDGYASEH